MSPHASPLEPERRHIPGIYNYCDRWCERCPFADRCAVNAVVGRLEPAADVDPLLEHLRDRFQAVARASRTAWQGWLDADTPDVSAAPIGQTQECGWRNNPLVVEARAYAALVGAWFEAETATLYEHADTLARRAEDDPAAELGADLELVLAAVEIVRRDAWLIPIKLSRALHTYEDDTPAAIDAIQNDRNGSAKVALLSMDRCEASWRLLEAWLPSGSAALLAEQLAALRVATERMFPHARRFLRAGFDVPVPVPAPDEGDGPTGISGH